MINLPLTFSYFKELEIFKEIEENNRLLSIKDNKNKQWVYERYVLYMISRSTEIGSFIRSPVDYKKDSLIHLFYNISDKNANIAREKKEEVYKSYFADYGIYYKSFEEMISKQQKNIFFDLWHRGYFEHNNYDQFVITEKGWLASRVLNRIGLDVKSMFSFKINSLIRTINYKKR